MLLIALYLVTCAYLCENYKSYIKNMSKRPTTISRKELTNVELSTNTYGYAIIGDTITATLYAKRLLGNKITTPITLINEGVDRTNLNRLTDTSFVADNNKRILRYLITQQIRMIPAGDNQDEDDDLIDTQVDRIIHYYTGAGPLGDFIAAYHIPRLGPWFGCASSGNLERFLITSTIKFALNSQETIVANAIATTWSLPLTSTVIVKVPSVLNTHYEFLRPRDNSYTREIFLDDYHVNNQANNVDYVTEIDDLQFIQVTGATAGLYNITGSSGLSLTGVRPIWKTDLFTYLRLSTEAGIDPGMLNIPVFYRAVLPIAINNTGTTGGINLTGLTNNGDLITTHIAFSLYDLNNPKQSTLTWLAQCYTTVEDLSVVEPAGKYADTGKTLLIVEAVNTKNRRRAIYNASEHEVQINYNDRIMEHGYLEQFAQIVAKIYSIYTEQTISSDTLLADSSICGAIGECQDGNIIVDYTSRESPMVTVLNLTSQLYGLDIYPNPGKF